LEIGRGGRGVKRRMWRGREGWEGEGRERGMEQNGERVGKGEGVIDLDICSGAPGVTSVFRAPQVPSYATGHHEQRQ